MSDWIEEESNPLIRKMFELVLSTKAIGSASEENGGEFEINKNINNTQQQQYINDFVSADLSDIIKSSRIESGAVDNALMTFYDELYEKGLIDMLANLGPEFCQMTDKTSGIPMSWEERELLATDIDWNDEESRYQDGRILTHMSVLVSLMYGSFYLGAYSARTVDQISALDHLWNIENE